jgi:hypothetical protein
MKPFSFLATFVIIGSGFFAWRSMEFHTKQDIQDHKTELRNKLIHSSSWSGLYTILLLLIVCGAKAASEGGTSDFNSTSSSMRSDDDSGFDVTDLISGIDFSGGNDE